MTTQFTERLNDLLDLWEEGRSRGDLTSVDELCRESPDLLPLLKEQIAKLEQMNVWLVPTENLEDEATTAWTLGESRGDAESAAMEMGTTLETYARYRMIRSHAKGGLGEVLVAEDQQLKRQVALKRIQAKHDRDPERRRRFLIVAEVGVAFGESRAGGIGAGKRHHRADHRGAFLGGGDLEHLRDSRRRHEAAGEAAEDLLARFGLVGAERGEHVGLRGRYD